MATRRNNKQQDDDTLVDIVEVSGQAQDFFERNQNTILGGLAIIVLLIGGIFAYNNFYKEPKNKEAVAQITEAQYQFERDSFSSALTNPGGGYAGFLEIIENYGSTNSGNAADLYAGISYLNLGKYQAAIDYMSSFDADGNIAPIIKNGVMGDAYSELQDYSNALSYYKKAANTGDVDVLNAYYLKKLGRLNEKQGNTAAALEAYKTIQEKYSTTPDGRDIEKYIIKLGGES